LQVTAELTRRLCIREILLSINARVKLLIILKWRMRNVFSNWKHTLKRKHASCMC